MAVTPRPTVICPVYAAIPDAISNRRRAIRVQYIRPPRETTLPLPITKRVNRPTLDMGTSRLRSIEVEKLRHRVELLLEEQHALVLEDVADLAVGIEHVAELARAGRAHLDAGGISSRPGPLDSPRALPHHA